MGAARHGVSGFPPTEVYRARAGDCIGEFSIRGGITERKNGPSLLASRGAISPGGLIGWCLRGIFGGEIPPGGGAIRPRAPSGDRAKCTTSDLIIVGFPPNGTSRLANS